MNRVIKFRIWDTVELLPKDDSFLGSRVLVMVVGFVMGSVYMASVSKH